MIKNGLSVIKIISEFYGVSVLDILTNSRKKNIVHARKVVYYFLFLSTGSLSIVSDIMNRNHSTIKTFVEWGDDIISMNERGIEIEKETYEDILTIRGIIFPEGVKCLVNPIQENIKL